MVSKIMGIASRIKSHPLRFLLRLEWVVLGVLALIEIPAIEIAQLPRMPILNLFGIILFVGLGLRLPKRFSTKLLYLLLEIGLVLILAWVGGVRLFQVLFLVIVMRNCTLFEGLTSAVFTGVVFSLYAITQLHRLSYTLPAAGFLWDRVGLAWLSLLLLFGLIVLFLQLLVSAVLQERQGREQLAIAHDRLRQYALKIEDQATLQERNRIAREIHDSLGHSLTVFNLHVEAALRLLETDPAETKALLIEAKQTGSQALREVRQSVSTLRSDLLQGRSLSVALSDLCADFQRSTGILPISQMQIPESLSEPLKITMYRIVQEALTNICKHAHATQVTIIIEPKLDFENSLQITIQDNGQGFDLNQAIVGFGLQGMQERVNALIGTLQILTAPQQGCQIIAHFPIHPPILP
jgi:signal transduction histidine kinase